MRHLLLLLANKFLLVVTVYLPLIYYSLNIIIFDCASVHACFLVIAVLFR